VLDISRIDVLRGIEETDDYFRIGATTTWTDIIDAPLPGWFDALKLAAREVGGVQIQNAGTIAGNLCNASPAADGVPPLLAMNAELELNSVRGARPMSLEKFIISNRETRCGLDEILTGLRIPKPANPTNSTFIKLGARKYLVISIVMVAAIIEQGPDNKVAAARIAVGSCSSVAKRLRLLERALVGLPMSADLGAMVTPDTLSILRPISDVRGTAEYRRDAAVTLVARAVSQLGAQLGAP
jgi:CO/xanthine dehydrogenase FAD-binding subunit